MKAYVIGAALAFAGASAASAAEPLVSPDWLNDNLGNENLVVLDVRNSEDGANGVFTEGHIPGSVYSNYSTDGWRTEVNGTPGMLPPIEDVEALIGDLGIDNDAHVVVVPAGYSSSDFGNASRVYWTFKVLGHDEVSILEGGFRTWADEGFEVATGDGEARDAATFTAEFRENLYASTEDVAAAVDNGAAPPLVDARPVGHYTGEETPGHVGVAGTLPGAVNIPHSVLVTDEGRDVIDRDSLAAFAEQVNLSIEGDQIAFCNTGHWASVGWFALSEVAGNDNVSMYDGSMIEWVADGSRAVEVGADRTVIQ